MLQIDPNRVHAVQVANSAAELWPSVQSAIELEHSTIPPYLAALFSIKAGHNLEAASIIGSVVGEEMLHMAIASNLMNAIGGKPDIDNPRFIPAYPGPLPMGVRSSLTVGLAKLSRRLVYDVFMDIEEPEEPIKIPVVSLAASASGPSAPPQFATIGAFYQAIKDKLVELGAAVITGDPTLQVADPRWYPSSQLFPILTLADAIRAIDIIVSQGEGTTTSPIDGSGEIAHYYRFGELVYGHRLVRVNSAPGWAYAGQPVPLDPAGVWDIVTDAKAADYPENSNARVLVDMFNGAYSSLLGCLHEVFNGRPERLDMALSIMVEMQLTAQKLVCTPVPGTSRYAAATFEYTGGGLR